MYVSRSGLMRHRSQDLLRAVTAVMPLVGMLLMPARVLSAQDVLVRIPVNLNSGSLSSTLPFDEPFRLVGQAVETVDTISATVVRDDQFTTDCTATKLGSAVQRLPTWYRENWPQADSFEFQVPTLEPNHGYSFCFRTVSRLGEKELTEFRAKIRASLDQTMRVLARDHRAFIPDTVLKELHQKIRSALPPDSGPIHIQVPDGSVFANTSAGLRTARALLQIAQLQTFASQRIDAANQFPVAVTHFDELLDTLATDPHLTALLARYYTAARDTMALSNEAAAAGTLIASLVATPAARKAIAEGDVALGPAAAEPSTMPTPVDFNDLWVTEPLDERLGMLARTQASLAGVRMLAARARFDATLAPAFPRPEEAKDFLLLIDRVLGAGAAVQNRLDLMRKAIAGRDRILDAAVAALVPSAMLDVSVIGTTIGTFETRAQWYVSADLGVLYATRIGQVLPYFGANFYLRAVNKRVPLHCRCLDRRTAVMIGLTATSLEKSGERDDLFGSHAALVGVGLRVTEVLRISGGGLIFRAVDPNPLADQSAIKTVAFISASLDWDARKALGQLGDALPK